MRGRPYVVAGRTFFKVQNARQRGPRVHLVESGQFWKGDQGWEHRAVCGGSVSGSTLGPYNAPGTKVTCKTCRSTMERLKQGGQQ